MNLGRDNWIRWTPSDIVNFNARFGTFEIIACYPPPDDSPSIPDIHGYLEVRALKKRVISLRGSDDADVLLFGDSGRQNPPRSAFARGDLDIEPTDKSKPLDSNVYRYLHIEDTIGYSGLIIERVRNAKGLHREVLWKRVGRVTLTGRATTALIQKDVFRDGDKLEKITLV